MPGADLTFRDLGTLDYRSAYAEQVRELDAVLAARERGAPIAGRVLFVEHAPAVVTVSRRESARANLIATDEQLARAGVVVEETDRGGDITYHGPGQLVVYPILDLNTLGLNLHGYMRLLEQIVIDVCAGFGVRAHRDTCATGVWVGGEGEGIEASSHQAIELEESCARGGGGAKICALGVRVRRWVTMHGLALNVTTNLEHFGLIVPCGLVGRGVTSLQRELGARCPSMGDVKRAMEDQFRSAIGAKAEIEERRAGRPSRSVEEW